MEKLITTFFACIATAGIFMSISDVFSKKTQRQKDIEELRLEFEKMSGEPIPLPFYTKKLFHVFLLLFPFSGTTLALFTFPPKSPLIYWAVIVSLSVPAIANLSLLIYLALKTRKSNELDSADDQA